MIENVKKALEDFEAVLRWSLDPDNQTASNIVSDQLAKSKAEVERAALDGFFDFRIARLNLRKGDIIVLRVAMRLKEEHRELMRAQLERIAPGFKSLILEGTGVELSTLRPERSQPEEGTW